MRSIEERLKSIETGQVIEFDYIIRNYDLAALADKIVESSLAIDDFMKQNSMDRFLDFVIHKVKTGYLFINNLAYPTKRIMDSGLENRIEELINVHMCPAVNIYLLKYFLRNIYESDTNLYLANLISSKEIIKSIYDTFIFLRKDIFISDRGGRIRNVRLMQQFLLHSETRSSSPLDACARLKYILEFFLVKYSHRIYTKEDILLSAPAK